jgi:hypothetical protein
MLSNKASSFQSRQVTHFKYSALTTLPTAHALTKVVQINSVADASAEGRWLSGGAGGGGVAIRAEAASSGINDWDLNSSMHQFESSPSPSSSSEGEAAAPDRRQATDAEGTRSFRVARQLSLEGDSTGTTSQRLGEGALR